MLYQLFEISFLAACSFTVVQQYFCLLSEKGWCTVHMNLHSLKWYLFCVIPWRSAAVRGSHVSTNCNTKTFYFHSSKKNPNIILAPFIFENSHN